jgi:hypothetical protein
MHRTCIIGLPRSGSQLCEKLVAGQYNKTLILGLLFDALKYTTYDNSGIITRTSTNLHGKIQLSIGQYLQDTKFEAYKLNTVIEDMLATYASINSISHDWKERLRNIGDLDRNTPVTIRLFLDNMEELSLYKEIVMQLQNLGFKFLSLEREFEAQVLSHLIARNYSMVHKDIFTINSAILQPVLIPSNLLTSRMIESVAVTKLKWSTYMKMINVPIKFVNYETMLFDLEGIYNCAFKVAGHKTISGDPYNWIINADEIRQLLQPFKQLFYPVN